MKRAGDCFLTMYILWCYCVLALLADDVNGQAVWRLKQKTYQPQPLDDNGLLKVCQMTNYTRIHSLLEPIMVPRIVGTEQHKAVGRYLQRTLKENNFDTEWDRFVAKTPYGSKTFRNLIATFDPLVHRRLMLACHYDSKIFSFEFLGATDSALPCALLLDIAQTLGPLMHTRTQQDATLQLVFFDGEEAFVHWTKKDSLYGARHLAEKWHQTWYPSVDENQQRQRFYLNKELDRLDVMVLLDLLGAAHPKIVNNIGYRTRELFRNFPTLERRLASTGCINRLPEIFDTRPATYTRVEDDHIPFLEKGVPILHLIPTPFPSVWHTAKDNWSALDRPTIENLSSIIRAFVAEYLGITPP